MIGSILSGTTYESLVHKLGRKGSQTTKELLDIATSHALGEEAVGAIFDHLDSMVLQGLKPKIFNRLNKFGARWVVELPSVL